MAYRYEPLCTASSRADQLGTFHLDLVHRLCNASVSRLLRSFPRHSADSLDLQAGYTRPPLRRPCLSRRFCNLPVYLILPRTLR
eukprot:TRINITY_DN1333_c0_g1_i4.p2 TRINITY_DN1333_c0_g1~~TRINITY_DN1333_c0_g1_i4.p2  ORF type:complete len:84 (+),score=10.65 TRINITY_DN1333_c0_g1_i4:457-708(+)